jgi:Xaa-Pro dipeptidase
VDACELDRLYVEHVAALERIYAKTLEDEHWDALVIHSGAPVKRSSFDDQFWPLRPVPAWQHWLPFAEAEGALVVRPGHPPRCFRTRNGSFWEKAPVPETEVFTRLFETQFVSRPEDVRAHLPAGRVAFIGEARSRAESFGLVDDAFCPPSLLVAVEALRVKKTPYEVACIAEANRRARAGHVALRDAFGHGDAAELDLHLLFLQATSQDDAETPYKNIVALGQNAATLHHVAYGRRVAKREAESLLVDAAATCRGYAADVTRTWVKGRGDAADAFRALVTAVDAMQRRLCAAIRVGQPYEQLHDDAHPQVAAILRDLGVLKGSVEEGVATGVTRAFFPHGLGHSLGLQTHDVGCALRPPRQTNPFLRNTTDVTTGQVFTIEPGIYFIEDLLDPLRAGKTAHLVAWKAVDALTPLGGVRIEDDLHVVGGADVVRNLTREHLPDAIGV